MTESPRRESTNSRLSTLKEALNSGTLQQARQALSTLHPAEIASLLESTPSPEREFIWGLVSPEDESEVLLQVNDEVRSRLIQDMDVEQLVAITEDMDLDDLADIIDDLPQAVTRQVIRSMDQQERARLESVLSYPEDSAGGLMNPDVVTVRPNVTLDVVLRYLRLRNELPPLTDSLVVVDRYNHYIGMLSINQLLVQDPDMRVREVMDDEARPILVTIPASKVAKIFQDRDLISAAVVNEDGYVLGRITIDDVVDVIREEAEHSLMGMAGLDEEEDMFAPVIPAFRRRAIWLGINLLTAFLASSVVGMFQPVLQQVVALAVFMPTIASMGGVAGTQTLTLMIRALSMGQIRQNNFRRLLIKELSVGLLNGLAWAVVVSAAAAYWFASPKLGVTVALAMIINLLVAALAGLAVPLALKRLRIDPALAGAVVLTTFTDCMGFFSLLSIGTLLFLQS